ncbi:hypothetical protein BLA29_005010 [Euroglyphus maynei]|uniref:Uncharacterized protein n=1 Tax=Euroglyphus maynei TaxID=6958 RepID=A0A1Y3B869_EURMA|nr:hypothetical protein BLA29_005010 [Euroglyphus maynei]
MGTDQQGSFIYILPNSLFLINILFPQYIAYVLISLLLLTVVYGPFVLWYFDGWYRSFQYLSRLCKHKHSNPTDGNDGQTPLALRSSLDFRITKPLKLNLRRLVVTQSDVGDRQLKSKIGVRKFGALPPKMLPLVTDSIDDSDQSN